jgi:hypothetical protein
MTTPLWEKLEDDTVKLTGGQATAASGRLKDKGDVHTPTLLIECKHRTHKGPKYAAQVQQDWCDTVQQHGDDAEKIPILVCGLTWDREGNINSRMTLCLKRDLALFQEREDTSPYIWVPVTWIAITEESLKDYCDKEQKLVSVGQTPKARPSHTMGGRPLSGDARPMQNSRSMSGSRPMKNGPSRWGR